ncbi:MAG: hypothetical protein OQL08_02860 [Gammaproteobacteria bacterium]|nr:hypothetical protein [Gammaproteobacteria bacterium]
MEVKTAFGSAISGMQRGMQGLERNADEIARASTGEGRDIAQPLVESHINQLQVEASARMASTLDDTIGSLLDEMA